MKTVTVKNTVIGEGMPKICAPLTGRTTFELRAQAEYLITLPADIAEWRADCFSEEESFLNAAVMIRTILNDMPLLFTFRTLAEGGEKSISLSEYEKVNLLMASRGLADITDVELFTEGEGFGDFVGRLHSYSVKVIASSHDFERTPPKEEILSRFDMMQSGGADILKIAVMPRTTDDVLTLLSASAARKKCEESVPFIALSMGNTGVVSRLAGECFGSALTFGLADKASAPGQVEIKKLKNVMDVIHESLNFNLENKT